MLSIAMLLLCSRIASADVIYGNFNDPSGDNLFVFDKLGSVTESIPVGVRTSGFQPLTLPLASIAFDGSNFYGISNSSAGDTLFVFDELGDVVASIPVGVRTSGFQPLTLPLTGIAFDGSDFYGIFNSSAGDTLFLFDKLGDVLASIPVGVRTSGFQPLTLPLASIAFDISPTVTTPPTVTPEPSPLALLGFAVPLMVLFHRWVTRPLAGRVQL